MKLVFAISILLLAGFSSAAQTANFKRPKPFPVENIFPGHENYTSGSETFRRRLKVGAGTAVLEWNNDELALRGRDRGGKPWRVKLDVNAYYEACRADFDRNGMADLLFITGTAANGFLPSQLLEFVMFDRAGRPVPFFVAASADLNDLVDLDRNGRAELRFIHYNYGVDGDKWTGYYVTDLYEAANGRWKKLERIGRRRLPILTSFEGWKDVERFLPAAGKPPKGQDVFSPDYANAAPVRGKAKLSFLSSDPFNYCYFNQTLRVLDSKRGREIGFLDADGEKQTRGLLKTAAKTEFYGRCEPDKNAPMMIWLTLK
ncbi:MAG: hypothetical protein JSS81_16605 [Acidobacteria bacterium]|nr:hypothetical protein [Acidobacteriota bacterium]